MRTTLRIDDQLLRDAKKLAAESGRTLTSIVEDALRQVLAKRLEQAPSQQVELPSLKLGGTMPGVDLDNNALLTDLMESSNDSV